MKQNKIVLQIIVFLISQNSVLLVSQITVSLAVPQITVSLAVSQITVLLVS